MGTRAEIIWRKIPEQYPHVELDDLVVMPNHMHGIIQIVPLDDHNRRDAINRVSTKSESKIASLSQIIRWYKGRSTFEIRKSGYPHFAWQSQFYEHVIRNEESMNRIRSYIRQNPSNWEEDELYEASGPDSNH